MISRVAEGETLPLFEVQPSTYAVNPGSNGTGCLGEPDRSNTSRANKVYGLMSGYAENNMVRERLDTDRHMQVALQLADTLKGRGRHFKTYKMLTRDQKHQVGNAICEHMLASLRRQVAAERDGAQSTSQ